MRKSISSDYSINSIRAIVPERLYQLKDKRAVRWWEMNGEGNFHTLAVVYEKVHKIQ